MSASATLRRWLLHGLSRRWLWLQLGACALLLALCGTDVLLVTAHVSCSLYRSTVQGLPGELLAFTSCAVGGGMLLWRLLAQLVSRQYRGVAWTFGLLAVELALLFAAFSLDIDKTLFYCTFAGVSIDPCAAGLCAH